ncbi:ricin-type beta-trefoil lectin domain protein [Dactylosporangium sp. NPDC050588]|uniref:ricin-type beta-trefoil lectin domain protein n=1 Tax=Dactylosporangium sp. NPDC050588 TaxID=3157211 RepID=UPI0033C38B32
MPSKRALRRPLLAGAALALASALGAVAVTAATAGPAHAAPNSCGFVFDDFNYSSSADGNFTGHGWTPRGNAGGPGVPGATWAPGNVTFPTSGGQKVMQLTASTNGTGAGTRHAEVYSNQKRYFEGTYASRIRFADAPASGDDGDHINETFFAISPLNGDLDPTYSELDFSEYLPNGGWGEAGPINYQTSWYTYRNEPWLADNTHSEQRRSIDGWHDLVVQVSGGHVKYHIDGVLVGDHSGKFYPRQTMTVNWNLWFIDLATHTGGTSTYVQQVDWFLFARNQVLSPSQATAQVNSYRAAGSTFTDTFDTAPACGGQSGTSAIIGNGSDRCIDVPSSNATDGNRLQIWDCNGTGAQQWTFAADGSLRALGKCMDVSGGGTADGTVVQLWTCNGTGAQKFTLTAAGDLVNPQSNKCVDVQNVATANGSKLHIWTCNGASNQKWHR